MEQLVKLIKYYADKTYIDEFVIIGMLIYSLDYSVDYLHTKQFTKILPYASFILYGVIGLVFHFCHARFHDTSKINAWWFIISTLMTILLSTDTVIYKKTMLLISCLIIFVNVYN